MNYNILNKTKGSLVAKDAEVAGLVGPVEIDFHAIGARVSHEVERPTPAGHRCHCRDDPGDCELRQGVGQSQGKRHGGDE